VQVADGRGTLASRLRLSGEISPGVTLDVHALDGATDVLGSQLGLAGRDTWHVRLDAARWHATVGEARAPSLGFLAPGAYGRGFAAGVRKHSWSADAFALRDRFTSSVREAAGVRVQLFRPARSWISLERSRLRRLHRKIVVVDGRVAFVGGLNVIDDRTENPTSGGRLDYAVRVEGPLVPRIHAAVHRLWWLVATIAARGRQECQTHLSFQQLIAPSAAPRLIIA